MLVTLAATAPAHAELPQMSDERLLLEVQHRAWRFFWEKADAQSGLVNDRAKNHSVDEYSIASVASTGYALAAIPIAIENGWIGREEGAARAERTLKFLLQMPHQRGWFFHFVDKRSGERAWNSEVSSMDTALLLLGALTCGQYFARTPQTSAITKYANALYRRIDWQWMLTNGGAQPGKKVLSHGWKPRSGFLRYDYGSYSEAIMLVLLGLGAPQNALPASSWDAIQREMMTYGGREALRSGPLFIHQMPMGFFNLRHRRDRLGWDYWASSTNAMQMQRQFALDNAAKRKTYETGFWGLNASDGPKGYKAYGMVNSPEDGTVSPTGAIAAITFTPEFATGAARAIFNQHGEKLWDDYGFGNAFNLDQNWFDVDVIGIDLGMALIAIENHRSGLIWKLMESHPATTRAFKAAGLKLTEEAEPRTVFVAPKKVARVRDVTALRLAA